MSFTIGRPIVKLIQMSYSNILFPSLKPYFNINFSSTTYSLTKYLPNLGTAASQQSKGINRELKYFTNYQLSLKDTIIELKKWILILYKKLIKSKYISKISLPQIITLDLF